MRPTDPLPRIDICVCTYRRPHLLETLRSLQKLRLPADAEVAILVVDNDRDPNAKDMVLECARSCHLKLRYVHCPEGNISIARNGGLDNSTARYLAFVDDDEVVTPGWISELLRKIKATGAAAVLGPVTALYSLDAPAWMQCLSVHSTRPVWVNGVIRTGYTCNVLIDRHHPAVSARRFDPALGQSGGEDTKFFSEVFAGGGQIVFAEGALVHENVPPKRASAGWLLRRRYRMGQTHGQLLGDRKSNIAKAVPVGLALAKIIYCAGAAVLGGFSQTRRYQAILRAALHAGVVAGLIGQRTLRQYGTARLDRVN
ncbi:glycosyltransferase [Roseovarius aestuarii]|uniref:GalNAc(5)-diNAcBac-PP-undecaprenol beta-1,3-glucosyltransferase n=1 Tax=Roseovarius aestuarii TaxID=475083 RepID=A0A1X7BTG6_9RHOB|nr:glycosyltransferase [Roseovarius aestuarii]SMC12853.1 GalNAc(5)-diNAcBac-PP-undecaprenol beta-1,3-glucosyltransferase [Roseovarius aestuarii]